MADQALAEHLRKQTGEVPGEPEGIKQQLLETGCAALQKLRVKAHHYCSHLNDEMRQCVIYDEDSSTARLIGVEYIISARLFEALPEEEKKYWHSHVYEVIGGILVAPGVPEVVARADMEITANTYGKVWHTWQVDRGDPLPYGPPQLMMAFTKDGQVDPELLRKRDEQYGIDTKQIAEGRRQIRPAPGNPLPGADHPFHTGRAWQTTMEQVTFKDVENINGAGI